MDLKYPCWAADAASREVSFWVSSCLCHPHHALAAPFSLLQLQRWTLKAACSANQLMSPWLQAGQGPFGHLLPREPWKANPSTAELITGVFMVEFDSHMGAVIDWSAPTRGSKVRVLTFSTNPST